MKLSRAVELISLTEARKITQYCQGLMGSSVFGREASGALKVLEHLGYVQIDTISVVERAHHHIFWSRVGEYEPSQLEALVAKGQAFEYWSHAASYLPMRDFRYSLPRKKLFSSGKYHWFKPTPDHKSWRRRILARINSEGALSARDFLPSKRERAAKSGWFERTPAKQALEQLFMEGRLMISGRQGFQKKYDLTERVLRSGVDTSFPSPSEHARHLIFSFLRSHGFARAEEMFYLRSLVRDAVKEECLNMLKSGELNQILVEGIERPYLVSAGFHRQRLAASKAKGVVKIISPFDSQVIQRKRLQELFGFDYLIECYVPAAKRKFGYFSLPILNDGQFIGQIDAKAHRLEKILEVRAAHPHGISQARLIQKIRHEIEVFAAFNGCEQTKFHLC